MTQVMERHKIFMPNFDALMSHHILNIDAFIPLNNIEAMPKPGP